MDSTHPRALQKSQGCVCVSLSWAFLFLAEFEYAALLQPFNKSAGRIPSSFRRVGKWGSGHTGDFA